MAYETSTWPRYETTVSYFLYDNFSEKKRDLIKIGISVLLSIAISVLFLGIAVAVTRSSLKSDISDLSGALVQLNLNSSMHREEMNKSIAMKHNASAETVANIASEVEDLHTAVVELHAQKQRILKVHPTSTEMRSELIIHCNR